MAKREDGGERRNRREEAIAGTALFSALVLLVLFQYPDPGLLPGHHGYNTSLGLAIAGNLGPGHRFLMITRMARDADGVEHLDPHNRLPIFSFALVAVAIAPTSGDPVAQVRAARLLMNLFLWGSLVTAYLLMRRISGRPLLSATVSLLAFSSYYALYYNDMVFNDIPALFGFLLLLLGIARWEQEKKGGTLYAGILLGVGFGWQAFGALGAWWALDGVRVAREEGFRPRSVVARLARRPASRAALVAVAWGCALLAFNLFNEQRATGLPWAELPSLRSIRFRTGFSGGAAEFPEYPEIRWGNFLTRQARRLMKATLPAGAVHGAVSGLGDAADSRPFLVAGVAAGLALLFAFLLRRLRWSRFLAGVVLLSGFFWTVPLKNFSAFHEYQSLFYAGFALVFYGALLDRVPRRGMSFALAAALGLFAWGCIVLNAEKSAAARAFNARAEDFAVIRRVAGEGRRIQVGLDGEEFKDEGNALRAYMAGEYYAEEDAELLVTRHRDYRPVSLTPGNREYFLFEQR